MMDRAVMHGAGDMRLEDGPQPTAGPGEVVIEVGRCGICGTDRAIFSGDYPIELPLVLGHEVSGTVVEVGPSVRSFVVGDRITVHPNVTCGACAFCQRGLTNLCERLTPVGITRPGGFATYTTVPETNAYHLSDDVSLVAGAMIEPLACCVRGIDVSEMQLGDTVLLVGAGPMACMMVQLVRLRGASNIIVAEPVESRRDLIRGLGADVALAPGQAIRNELDRATDRRGADVVFECAGTIRAAAEALKLVRRGGTVVWFGVPPEGQTVDVSPFWVNENEITIRGSFNNPFTHATALDLVASGRVDVDAVVTHTVPLEGLEGALDLANFPSAGKIVVDPSAPGTSGLSSEDATHRGD